MGQLQTIFYGTKIPRDKDLWSVITLETCVDIDFRSRASTTEQSHEADDHNPG